MPGLPCRLGHGFYLIIAEKPKAARRIAEALSYGRARQCRMMGVPFWVFTHSGRVYVVASSVGHLFGLTTSLHGFPVFEYYWAPLWQVESDAGYTKKYYMVLEKLCKLARVYINACDYDIEGSVIGYLIIKFLGDLSRAYRMRFSSLTDIELRRAFQRLEPLDKPMIEAGLARHELDWLWGVNVSRALMEALRLVTGRRVVLSAGRVQSPTLVEVVRRERERNLHVPIPSYDVVVLVSKESWRRRVTIASGLDSLARARSLAAMVKRLGVLRVLSVERRLFTLEPPPPFNLGDLQMESARILGLSPMRTQEIAERLYLDALISYPRTNSQRLPATIDLRGILEGLARSPTYRQLVRDLLSVTRGVLRPRQGPKEDPAHPAIHPTGNIARLTGLEAKLYDLIVRRFLACMAPPARLEKRVVVLGEPGTGIRAVVEGVRILYPGWLYFYPYAAPSEEVLPELRRGDVVRVVSAYVVTRYSSPPEPYTRAKLVKWMESVGIGTEATRARIVETLFERGYLRSSKRGIEVTDLGFAVAEILSKYFTELTSVKLTRHFEELLEGILRGRTTRHRVVAEAREVLSKLLREFRENHVEEVGVQLAKSLGLIKPTRKCRVCGREEYREGLCVFHYEALQRIKQAYTTWRSRTNGITFNEYLRKLVSLNSTGKWVKEVARYLLEKGASLA